MAAFARPPPPLAPVQQQQQQQQQQHQQQQPVMWGRSWGGYGGYGGPYAREREETVFCSPRPSPAVSPLTPFAAFPTWPSFTAAQPNAPVHVPQTAVYQYPPIRVDSSGRAIFHAGGTFTYPPIFVDPRGVGHVNPTTTSTSTGTSTTTAMSRTPMPQDRMISGDAMPRIGYYSTQPVQSIEWYQPTNPYAFGVSR